MNNGKWYWKFRKENAVLRSSWGMKCENRRKKKIIQYYIITLRRNQTDTLLIGTQMARSAHPLCYWAMHSASMISIFCQSQDPVSLHCGCYKQIYPKNRVFTLIKSLMPLSTCYDFHKKSIKKIRYQNRILLLENWGFNFIFKFREKMSSLKFFLKLRYTIKYSLPSTSLLVH